MENRRKRTGIGCSAWQTVKIAMRETFCFVLSLFVSLHRTAVKIVDTKVKPYLLTLSLVPSASGCSRYTEALGLCILITRIPRVCSLLKYHWHCRTVEIVHGFFTRSVLDCWY